MPRCVLVTGLALVVAACPSTKSPDAGPPIDAGGAGSDAGCGSGGPADLACVDNLCAPIACTATSSCPPGLQCIDDYCGTNDCQPPCALGQTCFSGVCIPQPGQG
jgi:hypothetical protein